MEYRELLDEIIKLTKEIELETDSVKRQELILKRADFFVRLNRVRGFPAIAKTSTVESGKNTLSHYNDTHQTNHKALKDVISQGKEVFTQEALERQGKYYKALLAAYGEHLGAEDIKDLATKHETLVNEYVEYANSLDKTVQSNDADIKRAEFALEQEKKLDGLGQSEQKAKTLLQKVNQDLNNLEQRKTALLNEYNDIKDKPSIGEKITRFFSQSADTADLEISTIDIDQEVQTAQTDIDSHSNNAPTAEEAGKHFLDKGQEFYNEKTAPIEAPETTASQTSNAATPDTIKKRLEQINKKIAQLDGLISRYKLAEDKEEKKKLVKESKELKKQLKGNKGFFESIKENLDTKAQQQAQAKIDRIDELQQKIKTKQNHIITANDDLDYLIRRAGGDHENTLVQDAKEKIQQKHDQIAKWEAEIEQLKQPSDKKGVSGRLHKFIDVVAEKPKADRISEIKKELAEIDQQIVERRKAKIYFEKACDSITKATSQIKTVISYAKAACYRFAKVIDLQDQGKPTAHDEKIDKITKSRRAFRDAEDALKEKIRKQVEAIQEIERKIPGNFNEPEVIKAVEKLNHQKTVLTGFLDDLERSWSSDCSPAVAHYGDGLCTTQILIDDACIQISNAVEARTIDPDSPKEKAPIDYSSDTEKIDLNKVRAEHKKLIKSLPNGAVQFDYSDDIKVEESFTEIKKAYDAEIQKLKAMIEDLRRSTQADGASGDRNQAKIDGLKTQLHSLKFKLQQARIAVANLIKDTIFMPDIRHARRYHRAGELFDLSQKLGNKDTTIEVKSANGQTRTFKFVIDKYDGLFGKWSDAHDRWYDLQNDYNRTVKELNDLIGSENKDAHFKDSGPTYDRSDYCFRNAIAEQFSEQSKAYQSHLAKFSQYATGNLLEDSLLRCLHELEFDLEKQTYVATKYTNHTSLGNETQYQETNSHSKYATFQKMQKLSQLLELVQEGEYQHASIDDVEKVLSDVIDDSQKQIAVLKDKLVKLQGTPASEIQSQKKHHRAIQQVEADIKTHESKVSKCENLSKIVTEFKPEIEANYQAFSEAQPKKIEQITKGAVSHAAQMKKFTTKAILKSCVKPNFSNFLKGHFDIGAARIYWKKLSLNPFNLFGIFNALKLNPDAEVVQLSQQRFQHSRSLRKEKANLKKSLNAPSSSSSSTNLDENNINKKVAIDEAKTPSSRPTRYGSTSVALDPHAPMRNMLFELANDFRHLINDQLETEKRAMRKTWDGTKNVAKTIGNGAITSVKALPKLAGTATNSMVNLTKKGLLVSVNGARFALQKGVYVLPQLKSVAAQGSMKGMFGFGIFVEGARTVLVFEKTNSKAAVAKHLGFVSTAAVLTSETLYTAGAQSRNLFIAGGSRHMLGVLRAAVPAMVAFIAYKVGTGQRFLKEDLPNWSANYPKLMKQWYVPYASETFAYAAVKVVDGLDYISEPISNTLIELGITDGYNPLHVLPFDQQIERFRACKKDMQKLVALGKDMKQRILNMHSTQENQKMVSSLFDVYWHRALFGKARNSAESCLYRNEQGKLDDLAVTNEEDRNALRKGNEILYTPFEVSLPNGDKETCYILNMSGLIFTKDPYGNLQKNEYIVNQEQFEYLANLGEFDLVKTTQKALRECTAFNVGYYSRKDFIQAQMRPFFLITGISTLIFEPDFKPTESACKFSQRKVRANKKDILQAIDFYTKNLSEKNTENSISKVRQTLSAQKASWLQQKSLSIVELDKNTLISGEKFIKFTSPEALALQDPDFSHLLYLKTETTLKNTLFRVRTKDGRFHKISKPVKSYEHQLVNHKDQVIASGKWQDLLNYQANNPGYTIARKRKETDIIGQQDFTLYQPLYGVSQKLDYNELLTRSGGDLSKVLVVDRIEFGEEKTLYALTHYLTKLPLFIVDGIENLNRTFSGELGQKYMLAKPYAAKDKHIDQCKALILRAEPKLGVTEFALEDSRTASDVKGDVFTLQSQGNGLYVVKDKLNRDVFSQAVTFKEIDQHFADCKAKAILVFGSKKKALFGNKAAENLEHDFLNAKSSFGLSQDSAVMMLSETGKKFWWVNNDSLDKNPNKGALFIRDYKKAKSHLIYKESDIKSALGDLGLLQKPQNDAHKRAYKDIYGQNHQKMMLEYYKPGGQASKNALRFILNNQAFQPDMIKKDTLFK